MNRKLIYSNNCIRNASEFSYELISKLSDMVRQLVFAAEVVNKFSNAIVRKKALNPLISNELVELSATMGKMQIQQLRFP
ncbi:MAG: hypothetical protein IPK08_17950 [Bacteroidetes bacterium]|nr:hypothetical protein [Bacteroidota bacterium]